MAATACRPLAHSPMISKSLSVLSNWRMRARAGASSSTMRVRIFMSVGSIVRGAVARSALVNFRVRRRDNQDLWRAFDRFDRFDRFRAARDEQPGFESAAGSGRQIKL